MVDGCGQLDGCGWFWSVCSFGMSVVLGGVWLERCGWLRGCGWLWGVGGCGVCVVGGAWVVTGCN